MREQVGRLKQRRLAGAIRADKYVPAGIELDLEVRETAKVLQPKLAEPHARTRAARAPLRAGAA